MTGKSLFAALLLWSCSCYGPIQDFDSPDLFTRPPEIWEKDGGYHLRVFEKERGPVGMGPPATRTINGDVQVWIGGRHSSGSHPNLLFDLGMPVTSPPPRFVWRNPDDSLIPMEIVRR
jgi:hypothetical protein